MNGHSRRRFLADVGRGMLVASVGGSLAADLGLSPAWGDEPGKTASPLTFGRLEPLVVLMQETPLEKLLPTLVAKLRSGTDLRTLVAAAALANARTFGGQDYVGFHSFMALAPAYHMAKELPPEQAPLPVLKVLYRNTNRIQAFGGRANEVLHEVEAAEVPAGSSGGELLQHVVRSADVDAAERTFAALARGPAGEAFNHLQYSIEDEVDVHRVVLAWRAFATLDFTGAEYAQSLLRQSVRYCVNTEQFVKKPGAKVPEIRAVLPKLLDEYKLLAIAPGERKADDGWIATMGQLIANASREQAADAVAAALADGIAAEDIGAAISLAANELVLRDPGRPKEWASAEKPIGSVHGDSVGVHASDAANAWRNIARVSNHRNAMASLIVGAFHTAGQAGRLNKDQLPHPAQLEKVTASEEQPLLDQLSAAIEDKDQSRTCAVVARYGAGCGFRERPIFDLLLRYGVSQDGALHAEKYYRTVSEEFASARAPFRWRQLIALSRVTASEYGRSAPGYAQARELLKV